MVRSIGEVARDRGSEGLADPEFLGFCKKKLEITGCRILELFRDDSFSVETRLAKALSKA